MAASEGGLGEGPITKRGFFCLFCGVERLGLGLELGLGYFFGEEGEGEGEIELLPGVKKDVIWRCWLTKGDRPLRRREEAIEMEGRCREKKGF